MAQAKLVILRIVKIYNNFLEPTKPQKRKLWCMLGFLRFNFDILRFNFE